MILRWDNTEGDVAALDGLGVGYAVLDGDLVLRSVDDDGNGGIVTRALHIEIGESVTFTPLGWMPYEPEHEAMFRARGVGA